MKTSRSTIYICRRRQLLNPILKFQFLTFYYKLPKRADFSIPDAKRKDIKSLPPSNVDAVCFSCTSKFFLPARLNCRR